MARSTDIMIRAFTEDGGVRAFAINSTRLCERARRVQGSWPTATAALGRVLSATVIMASMLKEGERLSLRVEGDGPLGAIFTQGMPDGRVRGFVHNPCVHPPSRQGKLDVGAAVGRHGSLYVIRDLGMQEPYVGRVDLQSGEIGEDIAYYLLTSEQQPSAVGLGVLVETDHSVAAAGGYIIQPLPGASDEVIARLERNVSRAPRPSDLILSLRDPELVLAVLLEGFAWQVAERLQPRFYCGCTRTKSRIALRALQRDDLQEMIANNETRASGLRLLRTQLRIPRRGACQVIGGEKVIFLDRINIKQDYFVNPI